MVAERGVVVTTIGDLLAELAAELAGPAVPPARAVARDLIAAVLDQPRFWPSAHGSEPLEPAVVDQIRSAAARLRTGMPLQYAVGKATFRHLTLRVDERVLIPRPETELLVDLALQLAGSAEAIADVGTGSGAVALSLAAEGSFRRVIATDVSTDALVVARSNLDTVPSARRSVVEFREGDLLRPLSGERLGAVVSNPPYIAVTEQGDLPAAVRDWEPRLALFGGEDGMDALCALVRDAPDVLEPGGVLLLELDARRAGLARDCAAADPRYRGVELRLDFTGRERFLVARRKET